MSARVSPNSSRIDTLFGDYAERLPTGRPGRTSHRRRGVRNAPAHLPFPGASTPWPPPDSEIFAKVDELLAKLRPFAEFNPDNFRSYFTLAEAERARAGGDSDGAVGGYLRTIEHAGQHGYVVLEAFANELLARHYRERGHRFAVAHFQEARALYLECGARGKAIHLEEEVPELRQATAGSRGLGVSVTPTTDRGSAHLDLGTALKASLAIAGEIALDQVVDRLVAISIENAGAERGVFVSVDGEDLRVEAEGVAGGDVRHHGSVPLDDQGDVVPAGARPGRGPHRRSGGATRRPRAAHHPQGRRHRRPLPREHPGVRSLHPRAAGASRGALRADGHLPRERPPLRPPRREGRRTDPGAV